MLSTIFDDYTEKVTVRRKQVNKPYACIKYYKKHHMAGMDLMDQIISVQKGVKKYYKKLFLRLLNIATLKYHVNYKLNGG